MTRLKNLLRRLFRRDSTADLAEEIEQHRAMMQADLEARGETPSRAALESRRVMGNVTLALEDSRDVWIVRWADRLWRDARFAARGLRREPAFALTVILT